MIPYFSGNRTRKIRFVFYNVPLNTGHPVNDLISLYTAYLPVNWGTPKENMCSHVELWISDKKNNFGDSKCWKGKCFSSTNRGDSSGVRFAPASKVLDKPENWKYIEAEVYDFVLDGWYKYAHKQVGKKYDWLGIFGFAVPINVDDPNKWYCSEVVNSAAEKLNVIQASHNRISPIHLCNVLCKELDTKVKDLI